MQPHIAITVGDPRGIGPEVVRKVLDDPPDGATYVVLGTPRADGDPLPADMTAVEAGHEVRAQIERAVDLVTNGDVDAIVTGPAEKYALSLAGVEHPGHTEWLAALSGTPDVAMMLTADRLRVVLVTTHMPLRDVPAALTPERVVRVGEIARTALCDGWDLAYPRLALCAVNPHAGDHGLFGREDDEVLAPAAATLGAAGPIPADTVFVRAIRGEFDAVLVPYHDVGMTAVKVHGFGRGVNVTLGLPFIRTAPDHGTAFDIAGRGTADPESMREAVRLAVRLAGRRAPTPKSR